ncbi:MAG TPA: MFS transporter [Gemmatimonadales bacterium]|nr:MFS transporter [Gemmatimonadales bacterium]
MTMAAGVSAGEIRAGRREWLGLAVIALPCLLYSMDLTVLNLAVPALSADLKPTSTELLWIVDIYGFLVAGLLIPMGTLGDRIGRRRLLLMGAAAFGVASVLAAFAASPRMLIAMRAVLGVAGATLAPSTLSLIRNMFHDPRERTLAIGVWITSYSAGAAIGPPLGGILLQEFWWGSVFLIGVPVMILLLVLGPVLLPEFRSPNTRWPDLPSAALSLTGVLLVIFGLKRLSAGGLEPLPVLCIATGLLVGAGFLRRQATLADPLIDLDLFRQPAFSASLATYMLGTFVAFGSFYFIAQYLQLVLGLGPLAAGLWTTPFAAAFIVGSLVTPVIAHRVRPGYLMAAGLAIAALGFAVLTQVGVAQGPAGLVVAFVIYSLGLAPVFTLATDLIVGSAPPERAGAAAAISETSSEFGGALGIAALGSIGTAVYRSAMGAADLHALPPEAAESARNTLGGAVASVAALPAPLRSDVLRVARSAFAEALELTAVISAVIVVGGAVLALVLLRRAGAAGHAHGG